MTQNRSNAVMATRVEAHDSLDHFPTPPWATRALCEWIKKNCNEPDLATIDRMDVAEPACGEGHMARTLAEYFDTVNASDVHPYGYGRVQDYLLPPTPLAHWTITNPPFRLADQFAATAIANSGRGAAMLVRTAFLESAKRHEFLFSVTPPTDILQFVERVPMFKGRLDRHGSTATAYCWLVWRTGWRVPAPSFRWIAPCRKRLERDSDYPQEET
jgi:hypothetical protein